MTLCRYDTTYMTCRHRTIILLSLWRQADNIINLSKRTIGGCVYVCENIALKIYNFNNN